MKKQLVRNIFLLVLLQHLSPDIDAQKQWLPCGNGIINKAANQAAKTYAATNRVTTLPSTLFRVYFHVFAYDDGSNPAATPAQIESEFANLVSAYTADNICFIKMGVEYINNSNLDSNFNAVTDPTGVAFAGYQVAGCINIFYLQKIKGNNNSCNCGIGGVALGGIPGTFFLVSSGNIGLPGNTIAHEMGHSLGLYHTFEPANGLEDINGANSATAADQVTDTPADPYVFLGQKCYSSASTACNYIGTCTDPNNQSNYNPPYSNLMSYWNCDPVSATSGQFARINSFIGSFQPLINCKSQNSFVIPAQSILGGTYYQTAISTLTNGTNVVFLGANILSILGAAKVSLEPGFHAAPTVTGASVKIVSSPCN